MTKGNHDEHLADVAQMKTQLDQVFDQAQSWLTNAKKQEDVANGLEDLKEKSKKLLDMVDQARKGLELMEGSSAEISKAVKDFAHQADSLEKTTEKAIEERAVKLKQEIESVANLLVDKSSGLEIIMSQLKDVSASLGSKESGLEQIAGNLTKQQDVLVGISESIAGSQSAIEAKADKIQLSISDEKIGVPALMVKTDSLSDQLSGPFSAGKMLLVVSVIGCLNLILLVVLLLR